MTTTERTTDRELEKQRIDREGERWGIQQEQRERHKEIVRESDRFRGKEGGIERRIRRNSSRVKLSGKTNGLGQTRAFLLNDGMKWQTFVIYLASDARPVHPRLSGRSKT